MTTAAAPRVGAGPSRRRSDAIAVAAGLAVLAVGLVVVRDRNVPGWERALFHDINDLPGALYWLLGPVQQLGLLVVGPIAALIAFGSGRRRLFLALLAATVAKIVLETGVKSLVTRERPRTSIGPDVHFRGDVPTVGESFVSGHALLATVVAGVVAPYLPARWQWVVWGLVGLVLFARVYVGAHNPLDVACGAGLGVATASALNLAFGVPSPTARDD